MARTTEPTPGGYDPAEARRKALLDRISRGGQTGGSVLARQGLNLTDAPDAPSARPTVAQAASPSEAARDRRSVLEQNEQSTMGPFASKPWSGPSDDQRADMARQLAETNARNAANQAAFAQRAGEATPRQLDAQEQAGVQRVTSAIGQAQHRQGETAVRSALVSPTGFANPNLTRDAWGRIIDVRTGEEPSGVGTALDALPGAGRAIAGIGGAILKGGAGKATTGIGRATLSRLGRVAPAADDAARVVTGPASPNSFRIVGGAVDDAISGASRAAQARSAAAAARQAAGTMDDASLAAARRAAQGTPLTQAVLGRIRRIPVARAVNPVTVGAGVTAGVIGGGNATDPALRAYPGGESGQNQSGQQGGPQTQQQLVPPGQTTPVQTTLPGVQTPQGTPPAATGPTTGGYVPPPPTPPPPPVVPPPPTPPPPVVTPPTGIVKPIVEGPAKTGPGTVTGPRQEGPLNSQALREQAVADLNGIAEIINAGSNAPDVMAIFASQGSKLIDLINQQEKALRAQAESEGRTIDPATQSTLNTLREQLGLQMKATKERLNARGLLDSGILIEAEQMLVKGNLSDQAKILAERLSRITENLNQSLGQMRSQRVSTATSFGMAGAQAQTQAEMAERQRMDDLRQTLISGRLGLGNQYAGEEQATAQRDFAAKQGELDRQAAIAAKNAELAQRASDAVAERMWRERQADLDRQSRELIAGMNNAAGPSNPTQATVDLATDNVKAQLGAAPDRATAEGAISAALSDPAFAAVNWLAVQQWLDQKWPPQGGGFKWPWE